jgi:hypothetical protein
MAEMDQADNGYGAFDRSGRSRAALRKALSHRRFSF